MGEVINIGDRYHKDYEQRIREIEQRIQTYVEMGAQASKDLVTAVNDDAREVALQEIDTCSNSMRALTEDLERLKATLRSVDNNSESQDKK